MTEIIEALNMAINNTNWKAKAVKTPAPANIILHKTIGDTPINIRPIVEMLGSAARSMVRRNK